MLLSQLNYLNILQSPYKTRTNRLLLAKQKPSRRRFRHLNMPFSAKQLRRSFDLPQDSSEERDERSCGNILYNFFTMRRDKRITPLITMITKKIITDPVEVEVTNKPLLIIRISQELSRLIIKVMITDTTSPEISSPTITSHGTKIMVTKQSFDK